MSLAFPQEQVRHFPERALAYPRLRYMGNKHRLLPWIWEVLSDLTFDSALDLFAGTGCVSYLLKTMGKRVESNDFLQLSSALTTGLTVNSAVTLSHGAIEALTEPSRKSRRFIRSTFGGIFFGPDDLEFLDNLWANLRDRDDLFERSLVLAALVRACLKKQPRGVFTVRGEHYDDGRRDLRLSLKEHFIESAQLLNPLVFENGKQHQSSTQDAFEVTSDADLVYLDPPYVPRSDDNCYIKRYHFVEGLMTYWSDGQAELLETSVVKKLPKKYTPFSYRSDAEGAFLRIFENHADRTIVLSYSSNGYPDLRELVALLSKFKRRVDVLSRPHRYHFGTHAAARRNVVDEYLIIGTG